MAPNVLSLVERFAERPNRADWTNAELAELYRVEHALVQARVAIETERGITDEGDPWFVFCRPDGEVVVHITRYDGYYRLYSPALPKPLIGPSFSALTKSFVSGLRTPLNPDATVSIHPAALLSVLVAAIFYSIDFHISSAKAAPVSDHNKVLAHPPLTAPQPIHQVELPAKEALFYTVAVSVRAYLNPPSTGANEQIALLTAVEDAAMALVVLSGTAEGLANDKGTSAVATDNHSVPQLPATGPNTEDNTPYKDTANAQLASKLFDPAAIAPGDPDNQGDNSQKFELVSSYAPSNIGIYDNSSTSTSANLVSNDVGSKTEHAPAGGPDDASLLFVDDSLAQAGAQYVDDAAAGRPAVDQGALSASADLATILDVNLTQNNESIDLSSVAMSTKIEVTGNGGLVISGVQASDSPVIELGANAIQSISIAFASPALPVFTIQLNGHDELSLANITANSHAINLTLDSEGNDANQVTIEDNALPAAAKLNITVVGVQDLTVNESAETFNNSSFDTSNMTGALTVGLSLDNVFQSVDLSQVGAANFVVGDSGNIALLHAASGTNIQLGSDLNIVDLTLAGASTTNPGVLNLDLQTTNVEAPAPITINLLDAFYTGSLSIYSTNAGSTGSNTIETLTDSSLATLTITGNSGLTIESINGPTATDDQAITIDAQALTGSLSLDVSGVADTAATGRAITIIGGSGTNILTNDTVTEHTAFVLGTGANTVNIGSGAIFDSIANLQAGDTVNIGNASNTDVVFNESSVSAAQATIDAQANIVTAAQSAASLDGSSAAHQAVLFSYEGGLYVMIDTSGNHLFNAATDAIVKLVGVVSASDLSAVFHSA